MGFFSRIWESITGRSHEHIDFGDDRINEIWEDTVDHIPVKAIAEFSDEAADLFREAFVDQDIESDARKAAREEFANLLTDYNFDIADFDWDAWRDWYDSSSS